MIDLEKMLMSGYSVRFRANRRVFRLIIITLDFVKFNVYLLATIHLLTDEILEYTLLYK